MKLLAMRQHQHHTIKTDQPHRVGRKFSGIYYCHSVRHSISGAGYLCELKLKKNALGKGAGDKSAESQGKPNDKEAPPTPQNEPPAMVTIDADSGAVTQGGGNG